MSWPAPWIEPGEKCCANCFWGAQRHREHGECTWTPDGPEPFWMHTTAWAGVDDGDGKECATFWRDERPDGSTEALGPRRDAAR